MSNIYRGKQYKLGESEVQNDINRDEECINWKMYVHWDSFQIEKVSNATLTKQMKSVGLIWPIVPIVSGLTCCLRELECKTNNSVLYSIFFSFLAQGKCFHVLGLIMYILQRCVALEVVKIISEITHIVILNPHNNFQNNCCWYVTFTIFVFCSGN